MPRPDDPRDRDADGHVQRWRLRRDHRNEHLPGACVDGACVAEAACGSGGACVAPPGRVCVSAQDIRYPNEIGTCASGTCDYAGWTATCSGGCAGTACAPGSWLTHTRDPSRSFWACVAMDPEDRPHVFYYGLTGGSSTALYETALTARGWDTRTIDSPVAAGLHHPFDCAIDRTGTAHVVYEDQISTSVRYARRPRGGTWGVEFLAPGGTRAYALLLRDLTPVAVYRDTMGLTAASRIAGTWTVERRAVQSPANAVAAFDGAGEVVVAITNVSSSSSGEPTQSRVGIPDASGSWTFENTLEVGWIDDIVIDRATDTIEISLSNLSPTFLDVHTRDATGRWTQQLVGGNLGDGRQGRLEVGSDGRLHVVFVGRCGTTTTSYGTCHAVRGSGGAYTVERAGVGLRARATDFALDTADTPHIAGPDDFASDDLIYLRPF
ncbi:MAG: hypothetical protein R3B82_08335 [Sandaracinaceae bacterium]